MSGGAGERVDFFVSYASPDVDWAKWIAWQLEAEGYSCLVQAWDFEPGRNFVAQMHRATTQGKQTLAVLSPAYLESDYAESEWTAAIGQDPTGRARALVPVRVADCRPPGLLASIVFIDLVGVHDEAEAKQRLIDGVRRVPVRPSTPPIFPGGPSAPAAVVKPGFPPDKSPGQRVALPGALPREIPWRAVAAVVAAALVLVGAIAVIFSNDSDVTEPSFTQVGVSPRSLAIGSGSNDLLWVADPTQPEAWWLGGDDVRTHQIFLSPTARPTGVALDADARLAWLVDEETNRAWWVDIASKRPGGSVDLGTATKPQSVVVAGDVVWIANRNGTVSRIDAINKGRLQAISLGGSLTSIAAGGGAIWVTDTKGDVVWRIGQRMLERDATNDLPGTGPKAVAYGAGSAWVANTDGSVTRIDAGDVSTISVSKELCGIAVGAGAVWVSDPTARAVWKIDPASNKVDGGPIEVQDAPCAIAAGKDVWVANRGDSSISRITR